ncbi:autoinducer binding domain-containing protein [Celeribacter sp.]|uniref:autoinducer binding domain-containing protein n=1 Tax=Celeribacter sp. TaxID=1890673 RepID=UPI003A95AE7D
MSVPSDLMTQIAEAPTLDAKHQLFAEFMEAEYNYVGVNYGLFIDTRSVETIRNNHLSKRAGLPDEWRDIYRRNRFAQDDFGMVMGAVSDRPILQSQFYRALDHDDIPRNFARVVRGVREFVSSGVVLPLEANGVRGILGLFRLSDDINKHDAQFERDRPAIQALANQLHRCSDWSDELVSQMGLSELNLKVLRLKAQGLRVKEILHEIKRDNPKTVDNHMRRVRKALGARNDMETIQRAAILGLLKEDHIPAQSVMRELPQTLALQ